MQDALYQARILDHAKNPRNKRELPNATHVERASNPSCGDTLTLFLCCDGDTIAEATFMGEGCAISQAAASLLLEKVRGMTKQEAGTLKEKDIYTLLGVEVSIGRQKCALLAWRALMQALR